jgi:serine/threonine-protein kinase
MPLDPATTTVVNSYGDGTRTMVAPGPATQSTTALPDYQYGPPEEPTRAAGGGGGRGRRRSSNANTMLKTAAWIVIPLLIVGAFIGVGYAFLTSSGDPSAGEQKVTIPPLASHQAPAAQAKLTELGLKVTVEERFDDEVEKGVVIGTEPPAGTEVEPQSEVKLLVSKGVKKVEVPNVIGQTVEEARAALEEAGFEVTEVRRAVARAAGKVYQTDPKPGQKAAEGSTVRIYIPADRVEVPDVAGLTEADAIRMLKDAGFVVKKIEQASNDVPQGSVISTSPPAGTALPPKTTVTIVVSTGPQQQQQQPPPTDEQPTEDFPTDDSPIDDTPTDNNPTDEFDDFEEESDPPGDSESL